MIEYFTPEERAIWTEAVNTPAFKALHLFERLAFASECLTMVQSNYRVVYETPHTPDDKAGILVPDPNWLAMALAGYCLPPIDAYIADNAKMHSWMAEPGNNPSDFSWDKVGGATAPYAEPIGPMDEEQAIEYLIMMCLPMAVWADHETSNRPRFKIVPVELVPSDRKFREAWRLETEGNENVR